MLGYASLCFDVLHATRVLMNLENFESCLNAAPDACSRTIRPGGRPACELFVLVASTEALLPATPDLTSLSRRGSQSRGLCSGLSLRRNPEHVDRISHHRTTQSELLDTSSVPPCRRPEPQQSLIVIIFA